MSLFVSILFSLVSSTMLVCLGLVVLEYYQKVKITYAIRKILNERQCLDSIAYNQIKSLIEKTGFSVKISIKNSVEKDDT